ncbi:hypothetical protein BD770DRAFT_394009, partial [Pilaira anomala]
MHSLYYTSSFFVALVIFLFCFHPFICLRVFPFIYCILSLSLFAQNNNPKRLQNLVHTYTTLSPPPLFSLSLSPLPSQHIFPLY